MASAETFRRINAYSGKNNARRAALLNCMSITPMTADPIDGGFCGLLNILELLQEPPHLFYQVYDNQCDKSAVKCYLYYRARHLGYFPPDEDFSRYPMGNKSLDFDSILAYLSAMIPQLAGETILSLEQKYDLARR